MATQNNHAFCVFGIAEPEMTTGREKSGHREKINESLIRNREEIILPPLHIKLGLIKQFVKALNKDGSCFHYLYSSFPELSTQKSSKLEF